MKAPYIEGYITANGAADKFGVDRATIKNWIKAGKMEGLIQEHDGVAFFYVKVDAVPPVMGNGRPSAYENEQYPKCPATSCFLNCKGRCRGLTECLYKEHKDGRTYCSFYKPRKKREKK